MNFKFLGTITLLIALSIVFGAMGAHMLKPILSAKDLESYDTATTYFWVQISILLLLHLNKDKFPSNPKWALRLIFIGTLMFSFSIYGLILFKQLGWNHLIFVPITPLGGLILILGWVWLAVLFFRGGK